MKPIVPRDVLQWIQKHRVKNGHLDLEWNPHEERWYLGIRFPSPDIVGWRFYELTKLEFPTGEYMKPDSPLVRKFIERSEMKQGRKRRKEEIDQHRETEREGEGREVRNLIEDVGQQMAYDILFFMKQYNNPGMLKTGPVTGL